MGLALASLHHFCVTQGQQAAAADQPKQHLLEFFEHQGLENRTFLPTIKYVCRKVNSFKATTPQSIARQAKSCWEVGGDWRELWIRLQGSFGIHFFRRKISLKMMMLCFVFKKCSLRLLSSDVSTSRDCESFMPTLLRETQESTLTSEICLL